MENDTRKKRASKSEREEAVAAFRASGMTQEAFARSRGLKAATFRNWLYASGGREAEPVRDGGFIEVAVSPSASPGGDAALRGRNDYRASHLRA